MLTDGTSKKIDAIILCTGYKHHFPFLPDDLHSIHIEAPLLAHGDAPLPALALVVSGGHTHVYLMPEPGVYRQLGRTRDDAAGEAFDKVAKLLGLGYPGGPIVDRVAAGADDRAVEFRVAKMSDGRPDYSFSGLKTAVLQHVRARGILPLARPPASPDDVPRELRDLAASFQRAVVTALLRRFEELARAQRPASLLLTGGVAANTLLRSYLNSAEFDVAQETAAGSLPALPPVGAVQHRLAGDRPGRGGALPRRGRDGCRPRPGARARRQAGRARRGFPAGGR